MANTCPFRDSLFTSESVDSNSPKRKKRKKKYIYMDIYRTTLDGNKGPPPTVSDQ